MKVMLLAAGKGSRMGELGQQTPKPLLRAGKFSLIEHQIRKLVAAGFTDLVINHAWLGEQIESALGDGSSLGARIAWSPEGEPLETAGGIAHALPLLGQEPFVVVNADVWTDYPFATLPKQLAGDDVLHLVLVTNPAHHQAGDFALSEQGRLQYKEVGRPAWTYSGIGVFTPALFTQLPGAKYPLLPLLNKAIAENKASAEVFAGAWSDIGTPERLRALDEQLRYSETP